MTPIWFPPAIDAGAIADIIRDNCPLTTLEVLGCTLAPRATTRIARALRTNTRLRVLVFSGNSVAKSGAQAFAGGGAVHAGWRWLHVCV